MNKHRFWYWLFEIPASFPYRFKKTLFGMKCEYRNIYCTICKKVVRQNYKDEE